MTRYEQGFLTKCAEYGVDGRRLLKRAQDARAMAIGGGAGALLGAGVGALTSRKHRLRNALIGALLGGGAGVAGGRYWRPRGFGVGSDVGSSSQVYTRPLADTLRDSSVPAQVKNEAVDAFRGRNEATDWSGTTVVPTGTRGGSVERSDERSNRSLAADETGGEDLDMQLHRNRT